MADQPSISIVIDSLRNSSADLQPPSPQSAETRAGSSGFTIPNFADILKIATFSKFPKLLKSYESGLKSMFSVINNTKIENPESIEYLSNFAKSLNELSQIRIVKILSNLLLLNKIKKTIVSFFNDISTNLKRTGKTAIENFSNLMSSFKDANWKSLSSIILLLPSVGRSLISFSKLFENRMFEKGMNSCARGLNKITSLKFDELHKAAKSLLVAAASLAVVAGSLIAFNYVDWESLPKAGAALVGLTAALFVAGKAGLNSSKGLLILGASLGAIGLSLKLFSKISWSDVGKGIAALTGLSVAATILSKSGASFLKGALSIAALGASLIPLSYALDMMSGVDWNTLGIAATALSGLAVIGGILGLAAPTLITGSVAIAALGASLIPLSFALKTITGISPKRIKDFFGALSSVSQLNVYDLLKLGGVGVALVPFAAGVAALSMATSSTNGKNASEFLTSLRLFSKEINPGKIYDAARSMLALSGSLVAFAAAEVVTGLTNLVSKFLSLGSDTPLEQLFALADRADRLQLVSESMTSLAAALKEIGKIDPNTWDGFSKFPWEELRETVQDMKAGGIIQIVPQNSPIQNNIQNEEGKRMRPGAALSPLPNETSQILNSTGSRGLYNGTTVINNITRGGDTTQMMSSNVNNNNANGAAGPIITGSAMEFYAV